MRGLLGFCSVSIFLFDISRKYNAILNKLDPWPSDGKEGRGSGYILTWVISVTDQPESEVCSEYQTEVQKPTYFKCNIQWSELHRIDFNNTLYT
jgi:predicted secreted protein